jgi:hypothetical protein
MKTYESALVALLLTTAAAIPCAAQQAPSTPQALPNDICAGCFAYLEFPPSLEPESYAMRGESTETPHHCLPQAKRTTGSGSKRPACLSPPSSNRTPAVSRPDHKQGLAP